MERLKAGLGDGFGAGVKCLMFKEPAYNNDSQHGGSLLTLIYEESPVRHSPAALFICLANVITQVRAAAGKQLYFHSPCLSGSVSIWFLDSSMIISL